MVSSVSEPLRKWHSFVQPGSLHCDVCTSITLGFRGRLQRCPRHPAPIISPHCLSSLLTSLSPPPSVVLCSLTDACSPLAAGTYQCISPVNHERLPTTYALQPSCHSPDWSHFWTVPPPTHLHAVYSRDSFFQFTNTFLSSCLCTCFCPEWNSSFSLQLSAEASILPGKIADSTSEVSPQLVVLGLSSHHSKQPFVGMANVHC